MSEKWKPLVRIGYELDKDQNKLEREVKLFVNEDLVKEVLRAAGTPEDELQQGIDEIIERETQLIEAVENEGKSTDEINETIEAGYRYFEFTSPEDPEPPLIVKERDGKHQIDIREELFDLIEGAKISASDIEDCLRLDEVEHEPGQFAAFVMGADSWPCRPRG